MEEEYIPYSVKSDNWIKLNKDKIAVKKPASTYNVGKTEDIDPVSPEINLL